MISMCFPFPNITGLISEQPIIYVRYNELEEFYVTIRFQCEPEHPYGGGYIK